MDDDAQQGLQEQIVQRISTVTKKEDVDDQYDQ